MKETGFQTAAAACLWRRSCW